MNWQNLPPLLAAVTGAAANDDGSALRLPPLLVEVVCAADPACETVVLAAFDADPPLLHAVLISTAMQTNGVARRAMDTFIGFPFVSDERNEMKSVHCAITGPACRFESIRPQQHHPTTAGPHRIGFERLELTEDGVLGR